MDKAAVSYFDVPVESDSWRSSPAKETLKRTRWLMGDWALKAGQTLLPSAEKPLHGSSHILCPIDFIHHRLDATLTNQKPHHSTLPSSIGGQKWCPKYWSLSAFLKISANCYPFWCYSHHGILASDNIGVHSIERYYSFSRFSGAIWMKASLRRAPTQYGRRPLVKLWEFPP